MKKKKFIAQEHHFKSNISLLGEALYRLERVTLPTIKYKNTFRIAINDIEFEWRESIKRLVDLQEKNKKRRK